jgi:hypothetical protein
MGIGDGTMNDYELFARSVLLFTEAVSVKACNEARLSCGQALAYPDGVISNEIVEIKRELDNRWQDKNIKPPQSDVIKRVNRECREFLKTWIFGKEEFVGEIPKREGDELKVVQNTSK